MDQCHDFLFETPLKSKVIGAGSVHQVTTRWLAQSDSIQHFRGAPHRYNCQLYKLWANYHIWVKFCWQVCVASWLTDGLTMAPRGVSLHHVLVSNSCQACLSLWQFLKRPLGGGDRTRSFKKSKCMHTNEIFRLPNSIADVRNLWKENVHFIDYMRTGPSVMSESVWVGVSMATLKKQRSNEAYFSKTEITGLCSDNRLIVVLLFLKRNMVINIY